MQEELPTIEDEDLEDIPTPYDDIDGTIWETE